MELASSQQQQAGGANYCPAAAASAAQLCPSCPHSVLGAQRPVAEWRVGTTARFLFAW